MNDNLKANEVTNIEKFDAWLQERKNTFVTSNQCYWTYVPMLTGIALNKERTQRRNYPSITLQFSKLGSYSHLSEDVYRLKLPVNSAILYSLVKDIQEKDYQLVQKIIEKEYSKTLVDYLVDKPTFASDMERFEFATNEKLKRILVIKKLEKVDSDTEIEIEMIRDKYWDYISTGGYETSCKTLLDIFKKAQAEDKLYFEIEDSTFAFNSIYKITDTDGNEIYGGADRFKPVVQPEIENGDIKKIFYHNEHNKTWQSMVHWLFLKTIYNQCIEDLSQMIHQIYKYAGFHDKRSINELSATYCEMMREANEFTILQAIRIYDIRILIKLDAKRKLVEIEFDKPVSVAVASKVSEVLDLSSSCSGWIPLEKEEYLQQGGELIDFDTDVLEFVK